MLKPLNFFKAMTAAIFLNTVNVPHLRSKIKDNFENFKIEFSILKFVSYAFDRASQIHEAVWSVIYIFC